MSTHCIRQRYPLVLFPGYSRTLMRRLLLSSYGHGSRVVWEGCGGGCEDAEHQQSQLWTEAEFNPRLSSQPRLLPPEFLLFFSLLNGRAIVCSPHRYYLSFWFIFNGVDVEARSSHVPGKCLPQSHFPSSFLSFVISLFLCNLN